MVARTITVDLDFIKEEVKKLAAYEGAKNQTDENQTYERLFISEQEWEVLEQTYEESKEKLSVLFADKLQSVETDSDDDSKTIFTLNMPDNFKTSTLDAMQTSVDSYIIQYLTGKWMSIANKESAEIFMTRAADMLSDIRKFFYMRNRPARKDIENYKNYDISVK